MPRTADLLVRPLERFTRELVQAMMGTTLRRPLLAMLRGGVRQRPRNRCVTAPAAYAAEVLAAGGGALLARLHTGSSIYVLAEDAIHRHIYLYGLYEAPTSRFLHKVARPGWTFLDVGANVGYYSHLAMDLGGPGSIVHAFEPNPRMTGLMAQSNGLRQAGRVEIVTAACGDHNGRASLNLSPTPGNSGLSSMRTDVLSAPTEAVSVELVTLDDYVARHDLVPNVIKIDVEGYELAVLAGAEQLLTQQVPRYVICEVAPDLTSATSVVNVMRRHRYRPYSLSPMGSLCRTYGQQFQNLVFTPVDAP